MNRITLIGRAGKDPETRQTESFKIANFSLAVSEHFKDKEGNKQEKTEWFNVVCFSNLAGIAEKYIHKGDQVAIEGKVQTRSWDDKDGNKKYITEVVANNIELIGSKKSEPAEAPASDVYERTGKFDRPPAKIEDKEDTTGGDDLPFAITILLSVGTLLTGII